MPRITFSDLAIADVLQQADWYETRADWKLALRWEKAVTSTALSIAKVPRAGAPCTFQADQLSGTRRLPVAGFPKHLLFYQFREDEIRVLRVVHGARDLETLFSN
ncbi:MAG: type II toxin-antitoxin system RelE/ParE family toxin [Candidatus Korobacteraceae bacterium]